MSAVTRPTVQQGPSPAGLTERRDRWWVEPLSVVVVLGLFTLYATARVLWGRYYDTAELGLPYLSPFYSPLINAKWWPLSPAILVMWAPLGFRVTCYYYRKAYYRAFFWDPPACAVRDAHRRYGGERVFPFVLQNSHRFFWFAGGVVLGFLWKDTVGAFIFPVEGGGSAFGIGLGSLILLVTTVLLTGYAFSCHSFRHLVGGRLDCFSCSRGRYRLWKLVSRENERHARWAWVSLVVVALADLYVWLVSAQVIADPHIVF